MLEKIIKNIFGELNKSNVRENFSVFEIKYNCKDLKGLSKKLSKENYKSLNDNIRGCKWNLYIEEYEFSLSQNKFENFIVEDETEDETEVIFNLYKKDDEILIVNENIFDNYISKVNLKTILEVLKEKKFPISFINKEVTLKIGTKNELSNSVEISNQCN